MSARPNLYGSEFDTLIQNHGISCDYEPAIVCDCLSNDSQQPLFSCPKCGGSGYRYLKSKKIKVVVTSFATQTEPEMMSLRESGTAYATPPPDIIMGYHDRLTFPDFRCKYSERLWIASDGLVTTKSFRDIQEPLAVIFNSTEFELEVDYTISDDKRHLVFKKTPEELFGTTFDEEWLVNGKLPISILYYTTPSYLVSDIIHELRSHYTTRKVPKETFEELPKQYRLSREWFKYEVSDSSSKDIEEPPLSVQPSLYD